MSITSKYKVNLEILISLIALSLISIITILSAERLLPDVTNLAIKQGIWFIIGFFIIYILMWIKNDKILKISWILYILGILSLIGLLLFAQPINNARCWFEIPGIGSIQPSEFMKVIIILVLSKTIFKFNEKHSKSSIMDEFLLI